MWISFKAKKRVLMLFWYFDINSEVSKVQWVQKVGIFDEEKKNITYLDFTEEINKDNTYVTNVRYIQKKWVKKGIFRLKNNFPSNLKVGLELQKMNL